MGSMTVGDAIRTTREKGGSKFNTHHASIKIGEVVDSLGETRHMPIDTHEERIAATTALKGFYASGLIPMGVSFLNALIATIGELRD